jgi:ribosomal protein L37AE/L43A
VDTTVIPPAGIEDGAMLPCSLPSLGSVLASDRYCPECDRDLHDTPSTEILLCETCVEAAVPPAREQVLTGIRGPGAAGP